MENLEFVVDKKIWLRKGAKIKTYDFIRQTSRGYQEHQQLLKEERKTAKKAFTIPPHARVRSKIPSTHKKGGLEQKI